MVLTFLLVLALTTSIRVGIGSGPDLGSEEKSSGRSSAPQVTVLHNPPPSATGGGGGFDGVILKTQPTETHPVVLIAPPPWDKSAITKAVPMSIPFSGEYWMFQAPWRQPPPWSIREQGRPTEVSFHTTNGRPMQMTADQKLNGPVDLSHCGQVQVIISRAGEDPAVLEVILIDSESRQSESLGTVEAAGNTLSFPIPALGLLDRFDEIKVVYHRPVTFGQKSARIAIERFVITPRA